MRPEELVIVAFAIALAAIQLVTRTFVFPYYAHPRFLQCTAVLCALVVLREYRRARANRATSPDEGPDESPRIFAAAAAAAARAALAVVRDFAPFFFVLVLYETLHDLTPLLRPDIVDGTLAAIDRAVFGADVSYWLGLHATPTLTRFMVFCYASYFVSTPILASVLYYLDERRLFRDLMLSGVVCSVLGYTGYLLVPAVGPYVYQANLFPTRLPGGGADTHLFIAAIDNLKGVARDCFPSLHTAQTTVTLVYCLRFRRSVFIGFLPIALGLYVSTVYLRMHYVVDVAAGFVTAALAIWLGARMDRTWRSWQSRSFTSDGSRALPSDDLDADAVAGGADGGGVAGR